MPTKTKKPLREIYSVMFELPSKPGYWTIPEGRWLDRAAAEAYAIAQTGISGTRAPWTVTLDLLMPGEAPARRAGRPLAEVIRIALEGLK